MKPTHFNIKHFVIVTLITSIWINASEVCRYFVLVMPRVKSYWNGLESVAAMNGTIFSIWGLWDTILTAMVVGVFWLCAQVFGNNHRTALWSAIFSWTFFFVLYWIGAANMGYSDWSMLWITLPLSLIELIIANFIAAALYKRYERKQAKFINA